MKTFVYKDGKNTYVVKHIVMKIKTKRMINAYCPIIETDSLSTDFIKSNLTKAGIKVRLRKIDYDTHMIYVLDDDLFRLNLVAVKGKLMNKSLNNFLEKIERAMPTTRKGEKTYEEIKASIEDLYITDWIEKVRSGIRINPNVNQFE